MTVNPAFCLGVWQDETPKGALADVIRHIRTALNAAREEGVDLVVFPECFLTGYFRAASEVRKIASGITSEVLDSLDLLADETGVAFVMGAYESTEAGVANAAHVFLPNVSRRYTYRKRALFGDWEKAAFENGSCPCLFEYRDHKFAVLICFDVEFPELVREAALAGADAVLVPTALMEPEHCIADFVVPARAIESGVYVAYANRIGTEDHLSFIGKSQICDPVARSRKPAPSGFRGLIHTRLDASAPTTDYLQEIRNQGLPQPT